MEGYCRPLLRRKRFRFHRLRGLVDERKLGMLKLAKAFAAPGEGARNFMLALKEADPILRDSISDEMRRFYALPGASKTHGERELLMERIKSHFLKEGIHTDFNRISSVGLVMDKKDIEGVPVYLLLTETISRRDILPARIHAGPIGSYITLHVSAISARLSEILDLLLIPDEDKGSWRAFERKLMLSDKAWLGRLAEVSPLPPEEVNVPHTVYIISMRSAISGLRRLMETSDSPEGFILQAINMRLDSTLAHEWSHLQERRVNGALPVSHAGMEILAHLMAAAYSDADHAFLSMLDRHVEFDSVIRGLPDEIREKGAHAYLCDGDYLKSWARHALEFWFRSITGKPFSSCIDADSIMRVQTTDYLRGEHLPLIERAMHNLR